MRNQQSALARRLPPLPDFAPVFKHIMTVDGTARVAVYNALNDMLHAYARAALAQAEAAPKQEADRFYCNKCGYFGNAGPSHTRPHDSAVCNYFASAVAAQPQQPAPEPAGWVSVQDRLPEPDSGEVLVWLTLGICALDEWHTHREDPIGMSSTHTLDMGCMWRTFDFEDITHWMPLPAAPRT